MRDSYDVREGIRAEISDNLADISRSFRLIFLKERYSAI